MQILLYLACPGLILATSLPVMAAEASAASPATIASPTETATGKPVGEPARAKRPASAETAIASEDVVCEYVQPTGSRIREKLCRTRAQAAMDKVANDRAIRDMKINTQGDLSSR